MSKINIVFRKSSFYRGWVASNRDPVFALCKGLMAMIKCYGYSARLGIDATGRPEQYLDNMMNWRYPSRQLRVCRQGKFTNSSIETGILGQASYSGFTHDRMMTRTQDKQWLALIDVGVADRADVIEEAELYEKGA